MTLLLCQRDTAQIRLTQLFNFPVFDNHYANMPLQYTANFNDCKNDNLMKKCGIFLIFA